MKNCPFYGYQMFVSTYPQQAGPFVLMPTEGNQCGLVTGQRSPCHMEISNLPVEWRECPLIREIRIGRDT